MQTVELRTFLQLALEKTTSEEAAAEYQIALGLLHGMQLLAVCRSRVPVEAENHQEAAEMVSDVCMYSTYSTYNLYSMYSMHAQYVQYARYVQ